MVVGVVLDVSAVGTTVLQVVFLAWRRQVVVLVVVVVGGNP